jgi:hypothetical protein
MFDTYIKIALEQKFKFPHIGTKLIRELIAIRKIHRFKHLQHQCSQAQGFSSQACRACGSKEMWLDFAEVSCAQKDARVCRAVHPGRFECV